MDALVPPLRATPPAQTCNPDLRGGYRLSLTSLNCAKSSICLRLSFLIFPYTSAPSVSGQKLTVCCLPTCSVGNQSVRAGFGQVGGPLLGMPVFLGPPESTEPAPRGARTFLPALGPVVTVFHSAVAAFSHYWERE